MSTIREGLESGRVCSLTVALNLCAWSKPSVMQVSEGRVRQRQRGGGLSSKKKKGSFGCSWFVGAWLFRETA
ncbi:hypothetical protein CCACVL1_01810, partial [Corchorus capsularis]